MRWRREELGVLTEQLGQQVGSAATCFKELVNVYTELEGRKPEAGFFDEVLNLIRMLLDDIKVIVTEQKARLDVAGAEIVEMEAASLWDNYVDCNVSLRAVSCWKEIVVGSWDG